MADESNSISEEGVQNFFNQIMEIWILPEVLKRQAEGTIEKPYDLRKAQIVFFPSKPGPEIRLNDEVRAKLEVELIEPMDLEDNQMLMESQIRSIKKVTLLDPDQDCGHITLIRINDFWSIYFNSTYNKSFALQLRQKADQFMACARYSLAEGYHDAFVDNLFSATELLALCRLVTMFRPDMARKTTHKEIHSQINFMAKGMQVYGLVASGLNRLMALRMEARYRPSRIVLTDEEAEPLLDAIMTIRNEVNTEILEPREEAEDEIT